MLIPSSRSTSSHWGGKMELTRTRLKFARCASRSAISKLVSFSLCRPTPLVKKALVGMNIRASITLELPPFVPDRGTQLDRRLRISAAIHRRLHDLRQHFCGAQRHLGDFALRLPALFTADNEHVFRRVDAQPPIRRLPRHDRGPPLFPLARARRPLPPPPRRAPPPPGPLPRLRYRDERAAVGPAGVACCHRST